MIYEITQELGTELKAQKVPVPVKYGPEPKASTDLNRPRIVVERDRQGGDQLGPRRSQHRNPRMRAVRAMGCVCRIYAKSSKTHAGVHDHERMADQLVDKVHVALDKIITARRTLWRPSSAKLLTAAELNLLGLEQWPGAVYELRFSVDRGVFDTTWLEEPQPSVALPGVTNTDAVSIVGGSGSETAC